MGKPTAPVKAFDNIASRGRLTKTGDEVARIRRRIDRLDRGLVAELVDRVREVDAALGHLRAHADMLVTLEGMRRR